jgi:hypothetical protein
MSASMTAILYLLSTPPLVALRAGRSSEQGLCQRGPLQAQSTTKAFPGAFPPQGHRVSCGLVAIV